MTTDPFTIHNLPYGVISVNGSSDPPRLAIAYKDNAIDIKKLLAIEPDIFQDINDSDELTISLNQQTWNAFASLPSTTRLSFRQYLKSYLLSPTNSQRFRDPSVFIPLSTVTNHLPFKIHNYSDFYCSHEHATNCSAIFNLKLDPASGSSWFHLPQVYNGRTSSLAVSGTPIVRPCGIFPVKPGAPPTFQAEDKLDFELEMGVWIGRPVPRGERLRISEAKEHIFGLSLLNDWSARSLQFYEMTPLGPFHAKGSLTSVSPWIVPVEALEESASCARYSSQEPRPLRHLDWEAEWDKERATWDVHVRCTLDRGGREYVLSESNLNELHWTPLQQVTHLASAGEGLRSGDVFGTGTISSSRTNAAGEKTGLSCIWERKLESGRLNGLPEGIEERLLEDGDEVVMTGWVKGENGEVLFGFGECRGKVLPAKTIEAWEE